LRLIVFHAKNFNNADIGWQLAPRSPHCPHSAQNAYRLCRFVFRLCRQGALGLAGRIVAIYDVACIFAPFFPPPHTTLMVNTKRWPIESNMPALRVSSKEQQGGKEIQ